MADQQAVDAWLKAATPEQIHDALESGKLDEFLGREPRPAFPG